MIKAGPDLPYRTFCQSRNPPQNETLFSEKPFSAQKQSFQERCCKWTIFYS